MPIDSLYCNGNAPLFLAIGRLALARLSPRYDDRDLDSGYDPIYCIFCGGENDMYSFDAGEGFIIHGGCFQEATERLGVRSNGAHGN